MSKSRKIFSFVFCVCFLLCNLTYADTVVIGSAPNSNNTGKTMTLQSGGMYMQNLTTGPGTLPSSSTNLAVTPIQSAAMTQTANNIKYASVDSNNVSDTGPTTQTISSPGANMAMLNNSNSNVIANNAMFKGESSSSTSDSGPTVTEITAPVAGGEGNRTTSGVIVNGQYVTGSTPADNGTPVSYSDSSTATPYALTQGSYTVDTSQSTSIPSYTTPGYGGGLTTGTSYSSGSASVSYDVSSVPTQDTQTSQVTQTDNSGVIIYHVNDNIQAVKPAVKAAAALVVNAGTREIYFSKNGFGQYAPASLANMVTAYILLSYKGLDSPLTVSASAVTGLESGAITAGLKAGDVITARDAIAAMFIGGCCDVANVVAENISGSVAAFANLMNQTVKDWGCVGTNFVNPSGLNSTAQYTNVYDMAVITDKVSTDPNLKIMMGQYTYTLPATAHRGAKKITTKNKTLTPGNSSYYAGIATSRMGYTSKAQHTMASTIDYNGTKLIAVLLYAQGTQFDDTTRLLNYAKVAMIEAMQKGSVNQYNVNTVAAAVNVTNVSQAQNQAQIAAQTTAAITNQTTGMLSNGTAIGSNIQNTNGSWVQDSRGWTFVKPTGAKAMNEWIKYNNKLFCVDKDGYMITGWREMSNGKMYYFDPTNGELRYNTWINVSTGGYYLQADGSLAKADAGQTKNIVTAVGTYTINDTGKAIAKVS